MDKSQDIHKKPYVVEKEPLVGSNNKPTKCIENVWLAQQLYQRQATSLKIKKPIKQVKGGGRGATEKDGWLSTIEKNHHHGKITFETVIDSFRNSTVEMFYNRLSRDRIKILVWNRTLCIFDE